MTKEQNELLRNANIPENQWELCTITQGKIYTPNPKQLFDSGIIASDSFEYQQYLSQQIDICLDDYKKEKIQKSKEDLQQWLLGNPLYSTVHNKDGELYTVTLEKQVLLTQNILKTQIKQSTKTTWNCVGGLCEEWTLEELSQLALEFDAYVTPRISKQQHIEVNITNCTSKDEVDAIEINYDTI